MDSSIPRKKTPDSSIPRKKSFVKNKEFESIQIERGDNGASGSASEHSSFKDANETKASIKRSYEDLERHYKHYREKDDPYAEEFHDAYMPHVRMADYWKALIDNKTGPKDSLQRYQSCAKELERILRYEQLSEDEQLGEIDENLKRVHKILSQYDNHTTLESSELEKWNQGFNTIVKRKRRRESENIPSNLATLIEDDEKKLNRLTHLSDHEDLNVKALFERVKAQLEETKTKLSWSEITLGNLYDLSDKITKQQACLERGERLSEIIQDKSKLREDEGMTKHLIDRSLETFDRFFVARLDQMNIEGQRSESLKISMQVARDFVRARPHLVEGEADDYFFVQVWPRTPSSEKTSGTPPYESYVNPKTGSMIVSYIYRNQDQDWKRQNVPEVFPQEWELGDIPENLHKKFWELVHASDLQGDIYHQAAKDYEKLTGNTASALREVFIDRIEERVTLDVLSLFVKPGDTKTFSKEHEGKRFSTTEGTPIGGIFRFMLAQNPEKVGDGEITKAEVAMHPPSLGGINYVKLYIRSRIKHRGADDIRDV
jgi:hypothetical protein